MAWSYFVSRRVFSPKRGIATSISDTPPRLRMAQAAVAFPFRSVCSTFESGKANLIFCGVPSPSALNRRTTICSPVEVGGRNLIARARRVDQRGFVRGGLRRKRAEQRFVPAPVLLLDACGVPCPAVGYDGEPDVRRAVDGVVAPPEPVAGVLHRKSQRGVCAVGIGSRVVGEERQAVAAVPLREVYPVQDDVVLDVVPGGEVGVFQRAFCRRRKVRPYTARGASRGGRGRGC